MTIKEIASMAGVSISTVSKIVNNKADSINPETKKRVLQLVKEYNYMPYGTVKSISTAKTFILGVLLRSASQANQLLQGIMEKAQEYNYSILLLDSMNSEKNELRNITALCRSHVDGVIWEPVCERSLSHVQYFEKQNISVCFLNSGSEESYSIDFIKLGYELTKKLIEFHHVNLGCLIKPDSPRSKLVAEGFRKCLFDHQLPYSESMCFSVTDNVFFSHILAQKVTGIISSHFASALHFYELASQLHYDIPRDLSLVSLQDDMREAITFPKISHIKIPYKRFGEYICEDLIAQCEQEKRIHDTFLFSEMNLFISEDSIQLPFSSRPQKILSIGSINMDITLNVDELPGPGKTLMTNSSFYFLGGKGANQAIGVARLGHEVGLIGKIGDDYDSNFIYDILKKETVQTEGIKREPNVLTGKAYVHVQRDSESTITILQGANKVFSPQYLRKKQHLFEHCSFCLISSEIPCETVLEAARQAKKHHAKAILKPAAMKALPDELFHLIEILVPNRNEAKELCPGIHTPEEQAAFLHSLGIPIVIITLGNEGCYLYTKDLQKHFPAADFLSVDSTGGADAFIAALSVYLSEGYPIEKAIPIANYAAGFCISRQGVVPALIDRNSLEAHIRMSDPDLLNP